MGKLNRLSDSLKKRFQDPQLTRQQLFQLMDEFKQGVKCNTFAQEGWPRTCYGVSKMGINVFAGVLSREPTVVGKDIQVYALCPGYVDTDMTSHKGVLTIQQGALTPVFLAELPFKVNPQYQGQFFEESALSSLG
jgi:NAD(P)-dependent dehydrogenase (short-subunit alcohol dehydrogenase family)